MECGWIIWLLFAPLFAQTQPLETITIELKKLQYPPEGGHEYWLSLPDSLRQRHFRFEVDRSVCSGDLLVNGTKLSGEDAQDILGFDRVNKIQISCCIERSPGAVVLFALPKVHISAAKASISAKGREIHLEVTLLNTLPNSSSVRLSAAGKEFDFFLGPETSQTRTLLLHPLSGDRKELSLELLKFAETFEGEYRHTLKVQIQRF